MINVNIKQNGKSKIISFPCDASEILYTDYCDYKIWLDKQPQWFKTAEFETESLHYSLKIIEAIKILTKVDLSYLELQDMEIEEMNLKLDTLLYSILNNCKAVKDSSDLITYKDSLYKLDDTKTVHLGVFSLYVTNKYKVKFEGDENDYRQTLYLFAAFSRKIVDGKKEILPFGREDLENLLEERAKHFKDITLQDAATLKLFFRNGLTR